MRFKHYSQFDTSDCGPACLRMIARHYGQKYQMETLRQYCHISNEGVSLLGIKEAAEYMGFTIEAAKVSFEQLAEQAAFPCILHWNQNHFVVCYGIRKHTVSNGYSVYIADPATQKVRLSRREFCKCWCCEDGDNGIAMFLRPGPNFGEKKDVSRKKGKGLLSFLAYILPYKNMIGQLALAMLIGSAIQLAFPFLTQALVDSGITKKDFSIITLVLISQVTLFTATLGVGFIRSRILLYINSRIDILMVSDFIMKLTRMPMLFFNTRSTGDIMQRIGDHDRIKTFLMDNSVRMLFSATNLIIFLCILAYFNLYIYVIFIAGNCLYVAWVVYTIRYRKKLDVRRFNISGTERNRIIQLIQGIQDIKLNNCEKQKRWEWERMQVALYKINTNALSLEQIQQLGSAFFSQMTNFLISFIAAEAVVEGTMTLGMLMSLTYIIGQLSVPVNDFISFSNTLQDARISLTRLNEIHSYKDEDSDIERKENTLPNDESINIEHLTFSYSGANRDFALDDISFHIPSGKVTAIVGESGSGKTTLIKLLLGFYTPNNGTVKVGDTNLYDINPHVWREHTGCVMQESYIFSDTVAKNIALSDETPELDNVRMAAKMANADDFISAMPLGYNTRIGVEGLGLSQGQRQRILIARAIYKNPHYLFFDEATNSLDTTNERLIMNNLSKLYKGRTAVISAHRLSTVRNADNIIVLKKGRIVEEGTHDELVALNGYYYTLVMNQLELEK